MWEWEKDFYKVMNTLLHGEVEVKDINKFLTYYPHQPTRNEHGILLSPIYAGKVRAIDHNKLSPLNINELKDNFTVPLLTFPPMFIKQYSPSTANTWLTRSGPKILPYSLEPQ